MTDDTRWVARMEDDMRQLRLDMRDGLAKLGGQIETLANQFTAYQLSIPTAYITRADLIDRLKAITDECDRRDESSREYIGRLEATIQKLIWVVIGALITGSLGLLNEIFHLLGHTP